MNKLRYALIAGHSRKVVERYLPDNYFVVTEDFPRENGTPVPTPAVLICGRDNAGWTMDSYVLPRLASGMIFGHEVKMEAAEGVGFL